MSSASSSAIEFAAASVMNRCAVLAKISDEPGCITRGFLSPAMKEVNQQVAAWMESAGLETELDVAGNLIGRYPAERADAPILVLGSHLDTVRNAGAFDGVLGVLLALAMVEMLDGAALPFELEVIAFADEEGLRYGTPFLGSRGLIGDLDPDLLECCDGDGVSIADAIRAWDQDPDQIQPRYTDRRLLGYVEAHIEQGPCLEHHELPLGVLKALAGAYWLRLKFHGRAGHAGTTPMGLRRDPMPAAAEVVLAAERLAREDGDLVATVGKLIPSPGAGNVIPGEVELSLDIRHADNTSLKPAVESLLDRCRQIAQHRDLRFEYEVLHRQDAVEADPHLSEILTDAATESGFEARPLVIGAGHDALIMSRIMPVTMLLLRSPGGISHHPDEDVLPADVEAALSTLCAFVRRLVADEERAELDTKASPEVASSVSLNSESSISTGIQAQEFEA